MPTKKTTKPSKKPAKDTTIKPSKIPGTNKYDLSEEQIKKLAARFWTIPEIASFFGVDDSTIRKRFPDLIEKGRMMGKGRLRDWQLLSAKKGNVTMQIWLGKQYLGQSESPISDDKESKQGLLTAINKLTAQLLE